MEKHVDICHFRVNSYLNQLSGKGNAACEYRPFKSFNWLINWHIHIHSSTNPKHNILKRLIKMEGKSTGFPQISFRF